MRDSVAKVAKRVTALYHMRLLIDVPMVLYYARQGRLGMLSCLSVSLNPQNGAPASVLPEILLIGPSQEAVEDMFRLIALPYRRRQDGRYELDGQLYQVHMEVVQ